MNQDHHPHILAGKRDLDSWERAADQVRQRYHRNLDPDISELVDLVSDFPEGDRDDVLANLVSEHLRLSYQTARPQRIEDYVGVLGGKFNEFERMDKVPLDLIENEYLARHSSSAGADHPGIEEYRQRFPGRPDVAEKLREFDIDKRYVKTRRQGKGGLGQVWEAYDRNLKRFVAIKEPNAEVAHNPEVAERLAREARLTAGLSHPAIISVHELRAEQEGALPFYVMPLVQGRTFREHIADYHRQAGNGNRRIRRVEWNKLLATFIQVCEAIAFAHERHIWHCDLKPDNIILGTFGETIVLDWGLAKEATRGSIAREPQRDLAPASSRPGDTDIPTWTRTNNVEGTPHYMAREQALGRTESGSDIFGLGAILFEVLTGQPPYQRQSLENSRHWMKRVREVDFPQPRSIDRGISPALEAICLKAMEVQPDNRYGNATELANDIRRWQADEPVSVYRERPWQRVARGVRRHVAATIATAVILILLMVGVSVTAMSQARRRQRELAWRELQTVLSTRQDGWRRRATSLLEGVVRSRTNQGDGSSLASDIAAGLDAEVFEARDSPAGAVTFDSKGGRVFYSGVGQGKSTVWDLISGAVHTSQHAGPGWVAFAPDGSALQVVAVNPRRYLIWDVLEQRKVRELLIPFDGKQDVPQLLPAMALDRDARFFAASAIMPDATPRTAVWSVETGELTHQFAVKAESLAWSPDGSLLAAGGHQGRVRVWSRVSGEVEHDVSRDEATVHALAFGRDSEATRAGNAKWLLAAGDASGTVAIWDLARGLPRNYCRGPRPVYCVAFSPDGVTLASAGRGKVRLWDVATGRQLLAITAGNTMHGLTFSPDGRRIAATAIRAHSSPGFVRVYDLATGQGVQKLRGLAARVNQIWFSPDDRLLAALSQSWRVAIWDTRSSQLVRTIQMPEGVFTDNADLAFSPDRKSLVFSAGDRVTQWSLSSGKLEAEWHVPQGLADKVRFHRSGKLLLTRVETLAGKRGPIVRCRPTSVSARVSSPRPEGRRRRMEQAAG